VETRWLEREQVSHTTRGRFTAKQLQFDAGKQLLVEAKKIAIFCPLRTTSCTDRCVSTVLLHLYHFANSLRLAKPSIFRLFPCSRRLPFKQIIVFWESLLLRMFSVDLYEEPASDDYGKASRNVACESPDTMTKNRYLLQCPAPTVLSS